MKFLTILGKIVLAILEIVALCMFGIILVGATSIASFCIKFGVAHIFVLLVITSLISIFNGFVAIYYYFKKEDEDDED